MAVHSLRGGSRNSLRGGGLGQNSSKRGFRVQVRGNFHILTSKKKTSEGGFKPPTPPPLDPLLSLGCCLPESEPDVRPWPYIVWAAVCLRLQLEQLIEHGLIV